MTESRTRRSLAQPSKNAASAVLADPRRPARSPVSRGALSATLALGTGGVVVLLRELGILVGLPALVAVLCLVLLLPTARTLSGRSLLSGLALLGWNQVLWWWGVPFDRVTVTLAVSLGAGVAYLSWLSPRGPTLRQLIPEIRPVDAVPFLAAITGLFAFAPAMLRVDRASALALMLPGWDNSAHFNMFRMIVTHGRTIDSLSPPSPGDQWIYFDYPQSFHATAATVTQLLWPHAASDVGASLVAYNRSTALVLIAAVTVLASGIASMPTMRARWDIAAPLTALVVAAFFFGPGMVSVNSGFASFVFPCALLGAAVFVASAMRRVAQPGHLVALGGATVGVAHGWILLLALALPVVLSAALPLTASRWKAERREWLAVAAIAGATGYGVYRAAGIVFRSASGSTLTAPGGITPPPVGILVALAFAALAAALSAYARQGTRPSAILEGVPTRVLAVSTLIPIAALLAIYLAVMQIDYNGTVGYYFWKLLTAFELIVVAVLVAGIAVHPHQRMKPTGRGRKWVLPATIAVSVAATQLFGYIGPAARDFALVSTDPLFDFRIAHRQRVLDLEPSAEQLLLASTIAPTGAQDSVYLSNPGILDPINAQQWYLALRGTWTLKANHESAELEGAQADVSATKKTAIDWLQSHQGVLVVPPDIFAGLLSEGADGYRLATW